MTDFLLVHGAWHGGWCWRRVVDILERRGHRVFTPSLTGLGDRHHLLNPNVGLATHVDDILAIVETEELDHVVLCAHSYGGAVALQVADRIPDRIDALVLLDAMMPQHDRSLLDLDTPERRQATLSRVIETDRGSVLPPAPAVIYGLGSPTDVAWVDRRCVPQPLRTFSDRAVLTDAWRRIKILTYASTSRFQPPDFREIARSLANDDRFTLHTFDSGHDAMIDVPDDVAKFLLDCAEAATRVQGSPVLAAERPS